MTLTVDGIHSHFQAATFNEAVEKHGFPAKYYQAMTCPCSFRGDPASRQPLLTCTSCDNGILWQNPTDIFALAPGRSRKDEYEQEGMWLHGMVNITFQTTITPGHLDMIEFSSATMAVNNEVHIRGATDPAGNSRERLRFRHSLGVDLLASYESGSVVYYTEGVDFTVAAATGNITWITSLPAGTQYSIRYRAHPRYVLWSPQSRDENGNRMPYRCLAQRLDEFKHPDVAE